MYKLINILKEIRRGTTEEFVEKAKEKWKGKRENGIDRYNYDLVDFKGNREKVKILCNNPEHRKKQKEETGGENGGHEWFEQDPREHLRGYNGCPEHKKEEIKKITRKPEEFIEKAQEKWKDKETGEPMFDYSEAEYVNDTTKVKILCNNLEHRRRQKEETGGENGGHEWFEQTPKGHLSGRNGCPQHQAIVSVSDGEDAVANALEELGYKKGKDFKAEYKIIELKSEDGTSDLRVDFYFPTLKTMIEFDGGFHFKPGGYRNAKEKFRKQVLYDKMKNEYCKEHGIKLIHIPYTSMMVDKSIPSDIIKDAIENSQPGELVLIGNYPKAGWNA